jgi:hypothetical protein
MLNRKQTCKFIALLGFLVLLKVSYTSFVIYHSCLIQGLCGSTVLTFLPNPLINGYQENSKQGESHGKIQIMLTAPYSYSIIGALRHDII